MKHIKSIGRYISYIHRQFHIYINQQLNPYEIGSGQFHFLMLLYKKDGINQETLAEELKIDKATCARAIHKLQELGYIIRERDVEDKRCYNIYLTDKAEQLHHTCKSILKKWTTQLLNDFTEEEKEQFFSYLERIGANATIVNKTK